MKRILAVCVTVWILILCSLMVIASDTVGYCIMCKKDCEYVFGCEYMSDEYHAVRHWCTECSYDQLAGCNIQKHNKMKECCIQVFPPENIEVFNFRDGMLICFNPSEDADQYTIAICKGDNFEGCHFIESDDTFVWISFDEYWWFKPWQEYTVRVQALSGYYASLFSDAVEVR